MVTKNNNFRLDYLPFDTEVFGIKCGILKTEDGSLSGRILRDVLCEARKNKFEHLVARVSANNVKASSLLEDYNFKFKMCSLELEKKLTCESGAINEIIPFELKYANRLTEITENAFSCGTRFHYEEKFKPHKVKQFYRRWIHNLINDREARICIHYIKGVVTGYIAMKFLGADLRKGHIGLFAVDKDYRGRGIGSKLLGGLEISMQGKVKRLSTVTESINYAALKVYINNRFSLKNSWNVFHLSL